MPSDLIIQQVNSHLCIFAALITIGVDVYNKCSSITPALMLAVIIMNAAYMGYNLNKHKDTATHKEKLAIYGSYGIMSVFAVVFMYVAFYSGVKSKGGARINFG